jgi:HEAT repeat protein
MKRIERTLGLGLLAGVLALAGCGKQASDTPPATEKSSPATAKPGEKTGSTRPGSSASPVKASALEKAYHEAGDSREKIDVVFRLGDVGNVQAVQALGRIFETETDPELKENILSALWVVDGFDKEKLTIYAAGILPTQPEDVRKEAIDGLGDLEIMEAVTLLQTLLNDPSEEIREAAKDAIELVEASLAAR